MKMRRDFKFGEEEEEEEKREYLWFKVIRIGFYFSVAVILTLLDDR